MKDIGRMTKEIKLLQLCIENSHGEVMPDCDTPEIRELFDELTEGVPMDWKEVRWYALEKTSVSAKELQMQLLEEKIKQQERILNRRGSYDYSADHPEEPDMKSENRKPVLTDTYSKKSYASKSKPIKPKRKNISSGPSFGGFVIDESEFEVIAKASKKKEQEDKVAPSFDDLGW